MSGMQELVKLNDKLSAVLNREYLSKDHERPAILVALMKYILLLNKDSADYARGKDGGYTLIPLKKVQENFATRQAALVTNIRQSLEERQPFQAYPEYAAEIKPILDRMAALAKELTIEPPAASPLLPAHSAKKTQDVGYSSEDDSASILTSSPESKNGGASPNLKRG